MAQGCLAAKREHNKAMPSAIRQNRNPAESIALGGDEKRRALDGNFYTASEFCHFYGDKYTVDALFMVLGELARLMSAYYSS